MHPASRDTLFNQRGYIDVGLGLSKSVYLKVKVNSNRDGNERRSERRNSSVKVCLLLFIVYCAVYMINMSFEKRIESVWKQQHLSCT